MAPHSSGSFLGMFHFWKSVFLDARTPFIAKALIVFGALYGVSPLDVIPDFIPLLGQLDDLGIIVVAVMTFLRMTKGVQADLRKKRDVVDTTARKAS